MATPFISVIMPAYNVQKYIGQAIESVLSQSYTNFELIISDDASQDSTVEIVNSYKDIRIRLLKNPRNRGYADNMNYLLTEAKGEYIVIQDSDDYAHPDRLTILCRYLDEHPEFSVVGSSYAKFDDFGNQHIVNLPTDPSVIQRMFDEVQYPLPVVNGCMMFRKQLVTDRVRYRDLKYISRAQDDDILFRISEKYKMMNVPEVLYYYRTNTASMTLNPANMNAYNYFGSDFVSFLKTKRKEENIDYLEQGKWNDIEQFFAEKKKPLLKNNPSYFELYYAGKYFGIKDKKNAIKWLFKALLKDPFNISIIKKIIYESFKF